jgi:hypothetical protein
MITDFASRRFHSFIFKSYHPTASPLNLVSTIENGI